MQSKMLVAAAAATTKEHSNFVLITLMCARAIFFIRNEVMKSEPEYGFGFGASLAG